MTTSLKQAFGGAASEAPWASFPLGITASYTGSDRMMMIDAASTDFIRTPAQVQDLGNTSLGYRRVDQTASGGPSEWLISWQTIATFSSVVANDLAQGQWGGSCIKNGKFYAGFYDSANAYSDVNGAGSYVVRADLTSGAIEAVFRLSELVPTVVTASIVESTFEAVSDSCLFWEVLASGNIKFWYGDAGTLGPQAVTGFAFVEFGSDGSTVASESLIGSYEGDASSYILGASQNLRPVYVAADESFVLLDADNNNSWVWIDSIGMVQLPTNTTSTSEVQRWVRVLTNGASSLSLRISNPISDSFVSIRTVLQLNRYESGYALKYVARADLDRFFKTSLENFVGVSL